MEQIKIVIESLLTGSQFEVAVNENDKILVLKSNIQKILGELDGFHQQKKEKRFVSLSGSWGNLLAFIHVRWASKKAKKSYDPKNRRRNCLARSADEKCMNHH